MNINAEEQKGELSLKGLIEVTKEKKKEVKKENSIIKELEEQDIF